MLNKKYEVIVGNIGTVLCTDNPVEANKCYGIYKNLSEEDYGRGAGENVTIMEDGEIKTEFFGSLSQEEA